MSADWCCLECYGDASSGHAPRCSIPADCAGAANEARERCAQIVERRMVHRHVKGINCATCATLHAIAEEIRRGSGA